MFFVINFSGDSNGVDNVGAIARGASAPHFFGRAYLVLVELTVEWTDLQSHVLVNGQET